MIDLDLRDIHLPAVAVGPRLVADVFAVNPVGWRDLVDFAQPTPPAAAAFVKGTGKNSRGV